MRVSRFRATEPIVRRLVYQARTTNIENKPQRKPVTVQDVHHLPRPNPVIAKRLRNL